MVKAKPNYEEIARIVIEEVCDYYGTTRDTITTSCRKEEFVRPRQIIFYLIRKYTNLSLRKMGSYLGIEDHSTVYCAIRSANNLLIYSKYRREIDFISSRIEGRILMEDHAWVDRIGGMITNYNAVAV